MSKIIKLDERSIEQCRAEFEEALKKVKLSDGKLTFTKNFSNINRKATVFFSEIAWLKMQTLIREFSDEVAWHGIARRGDDESKDEYIISDILVYPQEVTGSTVTTDQNKYEEWLMQHPDEVFNNIRMQGHSHVNMSVSPSAVDTALYDSILAQLTDDMFYIFLIYNKRGEKMYKVYDLKKNVLFETADVDVQIMDDGTGIERFLKDAKELVEKKTYYNTYYAKKDDAKVNASPSNKADSVAPRKGKRLTAEMEAEYYGSLFDDDDYSYRRW